MNFRDFLDSKDIQMEELDRHFHLEKEFFYDAVNTKGCANCKDQINQVRYPSSSWTSVYRCIACNSIILVLVADRMGGSYQDTIRVYKERDVNEMMKYPLTTDKCFK